MAAVCEDLAVNRDLGCADDTNGAAAAATAPALVATATAATRTRPKSRHHRQVCSRIGADRAAAATRAETDAADPAVAAIVGCPAAEAAGTAHEGAGIAATAIGAAASAAKDGNTSLT